MNGKNQTMTNSASLQLGGIAAVYLFWFVMWLVMGHKVFGPASYSWDLGLVSIVSAVTAFNASRRSPKPYSIFLIMIGLRLALLSVSWITYNPNGIHPFFRFSWQSAPDYSNTCYALFVFQGDQGEILEAYGLKSKAPE